MMKTIVAAARGFAIGYKGDLLIRISTDLKRFKEITSGHTVVMGYNTLLSLPNSKPLKNRRNIVLYPDDIEIEGAEIVHSIPELLELVSKTDDEVFVIGGGSVYTQLLPYCDTAYVTVIDKEFEADTYFPDLDSLAEWQITKEGETMINDDGTPYRYVTYTRK